MRRLSIFLLAWAVLFYGAEASAKVFLLDWYYSTIDRSCEKDGDCIVKDVHNCCGYYPQCVSKKAVVDADKVRELCKQEKSMSLCWVDEPSGCACIDRKCQEADTGSCNQKSDPIQ